jgi:hypothetical protein
LKYTKEFNDYIAKLTHVVNHTYKTKKTAENEHLWTAFDSTNEKVRIARAADHGPHLYKAAHKRLGGHQHKDLQPDSGHQSGDWGEVVRTYKSESFIPL